MSNIPKAFEISLNFPKSDSRAYRPAGLRYWLLASIIALLDFCICFAMASPETFAAERADNPLVMGERVKEDPLEIYRIAGIDKRQEAAIQDIVKSFETLQLERYGLLRQLVKKMAELQKQPMPKEDEVMATQLGINELTSAMSISRVKLLLEIRKILSARQRENLSRLLSGNVPSSGDSAKGEEPGNRVMPGR